MTYRTPVTEADLHAYVDGELSAERRHEVEAHLRTHPEVAREVEQYQRMNESLQQLYDPVLKEPIPARLLPHTARPPRPPRRRLLAAAAAVAWMTVGGLIGWNLQPATEVRLAKAPVASDPVRPNLVLPAAFAHTVYTTDIRHPVEVTAKDEAHLVAWLSKRLHTDIRAPSLATLGYHLVGGRLLPSTDRMAAQFMYEREDGLRTTLYVRRGAWENEATSFRFERDDALGVFYWIDGPLGYALIGDLERGELLALAEAIYAQLR
ncbi:anti-sigma factor family protein [Endothiovibrio diazotrophicus]